MIVGISGYIGSGKDTVAKIMQYLDVKEQYGFEYGFDKFIAFNESKWRVRKWAGKLKEVASLLTGIPVENFEDQEFKKTEMGAMWGMSVREFLQRLGTEAMRDGLHKNVWVNALMSDYKIQKKEGGFQRVVKSNGIPVDFEYEVEYPNWIISDTRFPNEAQAIKDAGGIIVRVNRPERRITPGAGPQRIARHASEISLDDWDFDVVIENDGTVGDLIPKVKWIMETYNLL